MISQLPCNFAVCTWLPYLCTRINKRGFVFIFACLLYLTRTTIRPFLRQHAPKIDIAYNWLCFTIINVQDLPGCHSRFSKLPQHLSSPRPVSYKRGNFWKNNLRNLTCWLTSEQVFRILLNQAKSGRNIECLVLSTRAQLLEAWLALTWVKNHNNLPVLITFNQWLALTMLRATQPRLTR